MYFKIFFTDYAERVLGRYVPFKVILVRQNSKEVHDSSFKMLQWKLRA